MKALIVTIAAALISLNVAAYNLGNDPNDYCVIKKNGKTVVEYKGREIKKDVTLKDGSKIKTNGTIVGADGSRVKLKDGECINSDNIAEFIKTRKEKDSDMNRPEKKEGEDRWDKSKDYDQPNNQKDMDVNDPDRNKDMNKKSDWEQKDYETHHPDSLNYHFNFK